MPLNDLEDYVNESENESESVLIDFDSLYDQYHGVSETRMKRHHVWTCAMTMTMMIRVDGVADAEIETLIVRMKMRMKLKMKRKRMTQIFLTMTLTCVSLSAVLRMMIH